MGRVMRALGEEHEGQKLLCLEGLIGAGKTTLINELRRTKDFYFITEPVLQWQRQIDSRSLLGNLYSDFHRWSYTFQVNSVLTRAQAIEEESRLSRGRHLVMERSLLSDRECFARLYFDSGQMSTLEWYWYTRWYDHINRKIKPVGAFVYLRVDADVALERIKKRARSEEVDIELEYLQALNRRYEVLFAGGEASTAQGRIPVLVVDGNPDVVKDPGAKDRMIEKVFDFLRDQDFSGDKDE